MIFNVECTGEMLMVITEGASHTDGTALAEINRNRNSSNEAGVAVARAPTNGSDGSTTIFSIRTGATGVASKTVASGGARGQNEFILKQNTKYVVAVTTYAAVQVSLDLNWYEHTNKAGP
jgi:hypothetical protein